MPEITASFDTLLRQASMTADEYMGEAVRRIDDRFGEGYAQQHPELIAAFMQAAAQDQHGAILAQQLREGLQEVASAISQGVWDSVKYHADKND